VNLKVDRDLLYAGTGDGKCLASKAISVKKTNIKQMGGRIDM